MEFVENPEDIWKYRDVILSKISIVDLIKEYGIKLENKNSGQFSHRAYCPFHKGKDGRIERTPSFFISAETQSFTCFGCSAGSNIIDFIRLMEGTPPTLILIKLAKRVGLIDKDGKWDELKLTSVPICEPTKNIESSLFEISSILHNYIKMFINTENFDKELKWMEKIAEKADEFLSNIGYEDWEYAEELCEKVKSRIKTRIQRGK